MRNRWWLCAYPLFGVLEKDYSHLQVSVTGNPTYWLDVTSGSKSQKKPIFVSKQPPEYRLDSSLIIFQQLCSVFINSYPWRNDVVIGQQQAEETILIIKRARNRLQFLVLLHDVWIKRKKRFISLIKRLILYGCIDIFCLRNEMSLEYIGLLNLRATAVTSSSYKCFY